jgi:hypothetical protein
MAHRGTGRLAVIVAIALVALGGCRWREGRSVLIPFDGGPDADVGVSAGLTPEELFVMIATDADVAIYDVRSLERCTAGRVRGALCDPWVESALEQSIQVEDEPDTWLVVYDQAGEWVQDVLGTLDWYQQRTVTYLDPGFGAWAANEELPIDTGAP